MEKTCKSIHCGDTHNMHKAQLTLPVFFGFFWIKKRFFLGVQEAAKRINTSNSAADMPCVYGDRDGAKPAILRMKAGLQAALVATLSPGINSPSQLQRRTRFSLMTLFSLTAKLLQHNNNLSGRAPGCDKAPSLDLPPK